MDNIGYIQNQMLKGLERWKKTSTNKFMKSGTNYYDGRIVMYNSNSAITLLNVLSTLMDITDFMTFDGETNDDGFATIVVHGTANIQGSKFRSLINCLRCGTREGTVRYAPDAAKFESIHAAENNANAYRKKKYTLLFGRTSRTHDVNTVIVNDDVAIQQEFPLGVWVVPQLCSLYRGRVVGYCKNQVIVDVHAEGCTSSYAFQSTVHTIPPYAALDPSEEKVWEQIPKTDRNSRFYISKARKRVDHNGDDKLYLSFMGFHWYAAPSGYTQETYD